MTEPANSTLNNIPDFVDGYHLPDGEHECTFEDIEQKLLFTDKRMHLWTLFKRMLDRLRDFGITPETLLIDGSFVTNRAEPGDVDFGALIPPEMVTEAYNTLADDHDKEGLNLLVHPQNQVAMRNLFGAHMLVVPNKEALEQVSFLFRTGGQQFGTLRDPDPDRDPEWVVTPEAKGILKVNLK